MCSDRGRVGEEDGVQVRRVGELADLGDLVVGDLEDPEVAVVVVPPGRGARTHPPLEDRGSGLQPSSAGTPVSLGADAAGFSVNTAELAMINSFRLSVGSGSAGDLTVNAPIGPFASFMPR